MTKGSAVLEDLTARGLVQDTTDRGALVERLDAGPITLYCGFDPTADSLHVGNLIGLLTLRRFQLAGHRPIALAGGATGMIGDPSGRSAERNLLDDDALAANLAAIVPQLRQFLDFEPGPQQARLLDNRSWTVGTSVIDFLRDVGKHVTVNQMIGKESVRARLAGEAGISYTEFSYMLLQANDFVSLLELEGCELQVGGSDQWGNIALGVDLARRRTGRRVHGLTWPLLTKPDGTKYGKTAAGDQIWLGAHRMSPYRFYQAWIGVEDAELRKLLLQLTFLEPAEVDALLVEHDAAPHRRIGQRRLAVELTSLVHGEEQARRAVQASEILFGGPLADASEAALGALVGEAPSTPLARTRLAGGLDPLELFVESRLASSKGDARRTLDQRGLSLNDERLEPGRLVEASDLLHGRYLVLRRGKRLHLLVAE
ncbi:MAG: tyrosine--tRNA ligase [Acidimicrobiales bacterium]